MIVCVRFVADVQGVVPGQIQRHRFSRLLIRQIVNCCRINAPNATDRSLLGRPWPSQNPAASSLTGKDANKYLRNTPAQDCSSSRRRLGPR